MLNIIINIICWAVILGVVGLSGLLDRQGWKKPSIFTITLTAMIVSVSVVLTNVVSYNFPIFGATIRLSIGTFLLFVCGMLFGPFFGILAGIAGDSLGALINIQGGYSAIFTFENAMYGFMGGLVFLGTKKESRWWIFRTIAYYVIVFIVSSLALNTLWVYATFGSSATLATAVVKLIKAPIELLIYIPLSFIVFSFMYKLLTTRTASNVWCMQVNIQLLSRHWLRGKKSAVSA